MVMPSGSRRGLCMHPPLMHRFEELGLDSQLKFPNRRAVGVGVAKSTCTRAAKKGIPQKEVLELDMLSSIHS